MKNDNKGTGKRGRDPKIGKQIAEIFAREIAKGRSKKQAALLAGIHPTTVSVWLRRGRQGGRKNIEYTEFAKSVAKAEAEFVASRIDEVLKAAKPKKTKSVKRTVRNTYDLSGNPTGTMEVIEETTKREQEWMAAWKLLERKDRENWGDNKEEIAAIKQQIKELRELMAKRPAGETESSGEPSSVPARVSGNPEPPSPRAVDSGELPPAGGVPGENGDAAVSGTPS